MRMRWLAAASVVFLAAGGGAAAQLWFAQVGGTGGQVQAGGGPAVGFTVGGVAPGAGVGGQTEGDFGFWILPGGYQVPVAAPDPDTPLATTLFQNYPNPVHTRTTLAYRVGRADKVAGAAPVRLEVFDVAGRRVATLVDAVRAPGDHHVQWDGRDQRGRAVASGVYFARLSTGDATHTVRMLRVR